MALLRHRQQAISAARPGRWKIPKHDTVLSGDPFPETFDIPTVYWNADAVSSPQDMFFANLIAEPMDSTVDFKFSHKFNLVDKATNQIIFQQLGDEKRVQLHNTTKQVRWFDQGAGVSQNFAVNWTYGQWYRLDIEGVAGIITATLYTLPDGAIHGQAALAQIGGTSSTSRCVLMNNSSSSPSLGLNGGNGDVRWYEQGALKHYWPVDEGAGLTLEDVIDETQSNANAGSGNWVPDVVSPLWSTWGEGTGFPADAESDVITPAQFTAETGAHPPRDFTGQEILKVQVHNESATARMTVAVTEDPSTWLSWQPRFYASIEDYARYKDGNGHVWARMRAGGESVFTRGTQPNLSGLSHQEHQWPIFDPNDVDWIVGPAPPSLSPQNFGVNFSAGYVPGAVDTFECEIVTPAALDGFVDPLTVYFFDWVRDCGNYSTPPFQVVLGWDDSNDDIAPAATQPGIGKVHDLAVTHGIKNVVFHQVQGFGSPPKMTTADYTVMQGSGLWEWSPHADIHTNYQTRTAVDVLGDLQGVQAHMDSLGIGSSGSARGGSRPQNGHYRTSDNQDISTIEKGFGRKYARRGHYGHYSLQAGVDNPYKINGYNLGQDAPNGSPGDSNGKDLAVYSDWTRIHSKAKQFNCGYVLYGHKVVDVLTGDSLEITTATLNLIMTDLAADQAGGICEVVFFGEFAKAHGVKLD